MKKAKKLFLYSDKSIFLTNFSKKRPILSDFSLIWLHFGPNCTPLLSVTTLFIVVFALRGIIINEKSRNTFLYIEKKTFFDQNSEKNEKKMCVLGGNFWTFWPLTRPRGPQTYIFCFHYLCQEKNWSKWYATCHFNSKYLHIYSVWTDFEENEEKKKKKKKILEFTD